MESQSHGFKFEDIILKTIFSNKTVRAAIKTWKTKDYTAIFDIPEYSYLLKYYKKHDMTLNFNEEEYLTSLKLDVKLPLSIKSTKQSKSKNKKIEFGDIQRTIKNFSLYDVKEFSIIVIEYKQVDKKKVIKNTIVVNMDKSNPIIKDITQFAKSVALPTLENSVSNVKQLEKGFIEPTIKKALRANMKALLSIQSSLTGLIKIDSKNQRRVQCSIKKLDFVASQTTTDRNNTLFLNNIFEDGSYFVESSSRKFAK